MKYLMILLVGACLLVAPVLAEQQMTKPEPGPEQKRMENWLGHWACEFKSGSGELSCKWFAGGFYMVCSYKDAMGEVREVMDYNPHEKAYTMFRYSSAGWSDYSKGWIRDNTWSWVSEDVRVNDKLLRVQSTIQESANLMTFKYERSVDGEPWQVADEGKCTRVKD